MQIPATLQANNMSKITFKNFMKSWSSLEKWQTKQFRVTIEISGAKKCGATLYSIIFVWNRANSKIWFKILDRSFLRFELLLMAFNFFFMSLVNGNIIRHVPNPKIAKHFRVTIKLNPKMNCMKKAIKYPVQFFVSNGNLDEWFRSRFSAKVDI